MKQLSPWLFILLALAGCSKEANHAATAAGHADEHGHEEGGAGHQDIVLTPEAAKIAGIEIGVARLMPMQSQVDVPGVVSTTTQGRALVTPPVDGRVTRIHVRIGDRVKAGQPIVTLQSSDLAQSSAGVIEAQRGAITAQAAVKEARGEIDLANAKLRTVRQNLERQKAFAKTGAFNQPAPQAALRELNDAETALESAEQEQVVHEAQLERAERLYKQELISRTELEQARLELQQDKTKQNNARKQIEIAKAAHQRELTIAQRGLSNSREIQSAEGEVRSANLEVAQAKIRLQTALAGVAGANKGVQAARTSYQALAGGSRSGGGSVTVSAPISGVVADMKVTLGQAVERTAEVCEIANLNSVWVIANVPEKQIGLVSPGSRAQVRVSSYPGRVFEGVAQVVGASLDPKTRTLPVQVMVENAGGALKPGMFARVSIGAGPSGQVLAVPQSAVVEGGGRQVVYIAEEGGKYEEAEVELGRRQGDYVEILKGLEASARVVIKGGFVLKSEKVKSELKGHEH